MNDTGNQNQCMSSLFDFVDPNDFSKVNNDEIFKKIDRQVNAIRNEVDHFYSVPDFKGNRNLSNRADAVRCITNNIMYLKGGLDELWRFYNKYYNAINEGKIK